MLILKLLFVAASLLTQAWVFHEPETGAAKEKGIVQVTQESRPDAPRDSSSAETDSSKTGETWTIR